MPWFRLDDKSAFHSKVVEAGNEVWGAFCRAGAQSSGEKKDGFFSEKIAKAIGKPRIWKRAIEVGLLEKVPGGYQIHDYLQWNFGASQTEAQRMQLSEKRRKAGIAGARKRWQNDSKVPWQNAKSVPWQSDGKPIANENSKPMAHTIPYQTEAEGMSSSAPPNVDEPQPESADGSRRQLEFELGPVASFVGGVVDASGGVIGETGRNETVDRNENADCWDENAPRIDSKLFDDPSDLEASEALERPKESQQKAIAHKHSEVLEIFEYWKEKHKPKAKRTEKRVARIRARLKEGFTKEDLFAAARGALNDDWLMGRDPKARAEGWRDISTIYRDAEQVERLIELDGVPDAGGEWPELPKRYVDLQDEPDELEGQGEPPPDEFHEAIKGLASSMRGE